MTKKRGYHAIYQLLNKAMLEDRLFTAEEISEECGLKIGTVRVYIRNKLINVYIRKNADGRLFVLDSFKSCSEREFINYCSQREPFTKTKKELADNLLENSIQATLAAIEIHNKPTINYRYQIVAMLITNAWELILKAYISKHMKQVVLVRHDGTTKPFEECVKCVTQSIGKELFPLEENLLKIYEYRCKYTHFYHEGLDLILLSLIQKSIIFYERFTEKYFGTKISELSDLYILPIGFKKPISPIDYITNKSHTASAPQEVKDFIASITKSISKLNEEKISETILVPYSLAYKSESRLKNADIIAAINQEKAINMSVSEEIIISADPKAKHIKIDEHRITDELFPLTYSDMLKECKAKMPEFKQGRKFNSIMEKLKQDANLHYTRHLDPKNQKSNKKDFYSRLIIDRIIEELKN